MANNEIDDWVSVPLDDGGIDDWVSVPVSKKDLLSDQAGLAEATMAADRAGFKEPGETFTPSQSAALGAGQGVAFDLADEGYGAIGALGEKLFGERLQRDFPESYRAHRDAARSKFSQAQEQNPKSYLGGQIAGGAVHMANPLFQAAKGAQVAKNVGKLALEGGLYGYGATESEDPAMQALATGGGAGLGVAGGVAGAAAGRAMRPIAEGVTGVGRTAAGGFSEGVKKSPDMPGVVQLAEGAKGLVTSVVDRSAKKKEVQKLIAETGGKKSGLSDEEFLINELISDGPNKVKDFFAERSAQLLPGQIEADQLKRILALPMEKRGAARGFDRKGVSDDLTEEFSQAYRDTSKAASKNLGKLTSRARAEFQQVGNEPVDMVRKALEGVQQKRSVSGNVRNILEDTIDDLGPEFSQLPPNEQFDRLLSARQMLGEAVNWGSKNELPRGQKVLSETYDNLNKWLQGVDTKREGDALYSTFKNFEEDLFKKAATIQRGRIKEFDPIKLEKLFKESDSGRRLMSQIQKARQALSEGTLSESETQSLTSVISRIEELKDLSDSKRLLDSFRYKQGPSSPAIERQASALKGSDPLREAITSPAGFINSADQFFSSEAKKRFGKELNDLAPKERGRLIRYWTWLKRNQERNLTPDQVESAWNRTR